MEVPEGLQLTPFDEAFNADPYQVYAQLRHLDPVHKDSVSFYGSSWTISDYAIVKALLLDKRLSVDPRSIGIRRDPRKNNPVTLRDPDMMNLDGPDHQRLRALVQKAFTPTSVTQFEPRIREIVRSRLDQIESPSIDIVATLAKPIPTIVIAEFIGVEPDRHEDFKQWTDSLLLQGYPMPSDAQWDEIVEADQSLRGYVQAVIAARRANPEADLVTRLIAAQEHDDRLTDREIIDMCCLLIGAGNFTTTDLISNSIYHAFTQRTDGLSPSEIVAEVLRFDSPVLAARRFALEDIEIASKTITKGSAVNLLLGAANHDPQIYSEPDVFAGDRDQNLHLTFGRGVHHCLGAALAKLEATITLELFLERYPGAAVTSSKHRKQMDFRGFSALQVEAC